MKRFLYIILCVVAILVYGFLVKSCNNSTTSSPFKIARDPTWYPLSLPNKGENLLAFNDELITKISDIEKFKVDLVLIGPNNLYSGLRNNQYDAIVSSLMPTTLTEDEFVFSKPYILIGPVLLLSESSTAKNLDDMIGKTIGFQRGSYSIFEVVKNPSINVLPFENILTSLADLEDGQIDGVIMNNLAAYRYSTGFYKGRLKVVTPPLTNEGLRIVALRGTDGEKLIDLFNKGLKQLEDNGDYLKLIKEWKLCATDCIPEK